MKLPCFHLSHATLRRLVLIAPFALFDEREPVADAVLSFLSVRG